MVRPHRRTQAALRGLIGVMSRSKNRMKTPRSMLRGDDGLNSGTIQAVSSVASTILVAVALVYAGAQVREAKIGRRMDLLLSFHDRYHQEPLRYFRLRLLGDQIDSFDQLSPEDYRQFRSLIDELNFLALLVKHGLLDLQTVISFFYYSPPRVWDKAQPYIQSERLTTPTYAQELERLVGEYVSAGIYRP
jgi:hypothetical protein